MSSITKFKNRAYALLALWILGFLSVSTPSAYAQGDVPCFERSSCPIGVPDDPRIDCGYLVVPEDYEEPGSKTIRLPVIIIHSQSDTPAPDPVLFTAGGPSYSSLRAVWWFAGSPLLDDRDMVILEQRGNLYAEPSLECDTSIWWEEQEGNTPCLDSLKDRGIDLTHYTTQSIVADIGALMRVLDYEEWNLYGSSYSTRLMQLAMRDYPESVRSVILHSVSRVDETRYEHDPEHTDRVLNVLFDDCAADSECAAAYPDLEAEFYEVFNRLNDEPVTFELYLSPIDQTFNETVDGYRLLGWMVGDAFYQPARPPGKTAYIPLLIDQLERGNTELLYPWLADDLTKWLVDSPWAWGLYFAINCQDDAPAVTTEDVGAQAAAYPELAGYVRHERELEICDIWGLPAAPPLATETVESDIPSLVLAGSYDPITPPEWSKVVADNLSNSYYYEFPSAGHDLDADNPCAQSIMVSFLDDPTIAPDSSCMADVPGVEFALPGDVLIASSMYEYYYWKIGDTNFEHDLYLFSEQAFIWTFFVGVITLVIASIVRWVQRKERETRPGLIERSAFPLMLLVPALHYGYSQEMRTLSHAIVDNNYGLLRFGAPADNWYLFALLIVASLLTVAMAIIAILAWVRRYWSIPERIIFTLAMLPAIAWLGLMAHWGWLTTLF